MLKRALFRYCVFVLVTSAFAQKTEFSSIVKKYVAVSSRTIAITHVKVIDGTGAPARNDQTIIVTDGKIANVGPSATVAVPPEAQQVDGSGKTVIPGLVGMHDHLFYPSATVPGTEERISQWLPVHRSSLPLFPLVSASGVRPSHSGSVEPYCTDLD